MNNDNKPPSLTKFSKYLDRKLHSFKVALQGKSATKDKDDEGKGKGKARARVKARARKNM